ncbi:ABC transporter substrate-binding protein [Butyrivibrio sp. YAB3001]|uniref:ABC transporter substrate-binding protein n=1 Tax=Butyrivibrio sp. YAB3001 TaxID=1520812 RepID=UPI0008F67846|nr:ABC transporter substrate-binding protein [Butyrivibrio sp. YAB3001]SFC81179.1 peptide/nickel transport system substrate-binding protein [Butyrivibrio sp. YAB3001]
MMRRRTIGKAGCSLLMVVLTTLTVALSGCSSDKAGDSANSSNGTEAATDTVASTAESSTTETADDLSKLIVGIPQDIDGLDPHNSTGAGTREVFYNIFEGLVKADENGNLNPAVASEYTISEDSKVYTFTLRDGIKFHDGSLVTVEDIKYSLERNMGVDGSEPLIRAYAQIDSVNIVDDSHVEVVLKDADSDFLTQLTVAIIPAANEHPETTPIGTGPYKYVSNSPQENFIVTRFDDYWGEKAYIKDVVFKIESNMDAIVMDLEGGSIDMMARVTSTQVNQLSDKFQVYEGTMNLVQALYLNNAVKPFDDVRVRQALCYAVDPQQIMDFVSDGAGTEVGSAMFPAFTKYYMPELNDTYNTDTEKAKELLKEAGYPDGFEFTITVPSNYGQHVDTAQVIAEELKEIGVTANIQEIEWNSWVSDVYSGRQYEATVVGIDASTLSASALLSRYVSDAGKNFVNFNSEAYDTAYKNAQSTTDDAEKTKFYKECETILSEEAASVYIQDLPEFVVLNKKFTGYVFYPLYVQNIAKIKPAE